jgi:hypothetical protein
VLKCCNIVRIKPQGMNTKPYSVVLSNTFCLLFPSSPLQCLCENTLVTWKTLTLLLARSSFCQTLPWALCSFHIGPYPWKSSLSVCLGWFLCNLMPLSHVCVLYLYTGCFAVKNTDIGLRNVKSLSVPLDFVSVSRDFSVSVSEMNDYLFPASHIHLW